MHDKINNIFFYIILVIFLGQHLISALLENEHKINTMSWWMAENSQNKVGKI